MGPTRCTPVALGFKGSEWGSKLGPVANNGENIASGRESLGMRPRNLRPCLRGSVASRKVEDSEAASQTFPPTDYIFTIIGYRTQLRAPF